MNTPQFMGIGSLPGMTEADEQNDLRLMMEHGYILPPITNGHRQERIKINTPEGKQAIREMFRPSENTRPCR